MSDRDKIYSVFSGTNTPYSFMIEVSRDNELDVPNKEMETVLKELIDLMVTELIKFVREWK